MLESGESNRTKSTTLRERVNEEGQRNKLKTLKNGFAGLVVVGALFLSFAPESIWHSASVTQVSERKESGGFTLPDLEGGAWSLEAQRGKVVLVNYWATWCPLCRAETPALVRLADEFKAKGFEVVGILLDEDTNLIRPFVDEYKVSYPILLPSNAPNLSLIIEVLPTTVLYDRQGRMAKRYVGAASESTFRADIESLLHE